MSIFHPNFRATISRPLTQTVYLLPILRNTQKPVMCADPRMFAMTVLSIFSGCRLQSLDHLVEKREFTKRKLTEKMPQPYHGGCECGVVRYIIIGEPVVIYVCHCSICQTQSGSAFGMAMRIHKTDFQITAGQLKSFTRQADSGQVFTNSFCADCGTRIYHQASKVPEHLSLKPGTLDDTSWLKPTHHVYVRSAQPWVSFPADAQVYDVIPSDRSWLSGK